jgi:hypothetical protein
MTSVVTNDLRKRLLNLLKTDIASDVTNYYIGFAKADSAGAIIEPNSLYSQNQVRHTLQGVKRLANASFVIPTVEWAIGEIYEPWSDQDYDQTNFYVVNADTNEVFICIAQGKDNQGDVVSTGIEAPTAAAASNIGRTFETSDGYQWRYMYKISNLDYATYRSNSFIPVKNVSEVSFIPEENEQFDLQSNAIAGEIIRLEFDSAGNFPSGAPTITIDGNGDSASFYAVLDGDTLIDIRVDSDGNGVALHGSGYDFASASLSYGDVSLRPVLAPKGGLNSNPIESLKSRSLMLQLDIQADENGTLLTDNDFRQVVLLDGLQKYDSDGAFQGNTGIAMRGWNITDFGLQLLQDEIIVGDTSGAVAKVFSHIIGSKLYYYQDEETGFKSFQLNEFVEGETSAEIARITSVINPDIDAYSGEILYINNVTNAVPRSADQTEDIRIVIQLG